MDRSVDYRHLDIFNTSFRSRMNIHTLGVIYPILDLFFTAKVDSFAHARALEEVQSVVTAAPNDVDFSDMAFASVEKALRLYVAAAP